jgi:hypothetical protein
LQHLNAYVIVMIVVIMVVMVVVVEAVVSAIVLLLELPVQEIGLWNEHHRHLKEEKKRNK